MLKVHFSGKSEKGLSALDALTNDGGYPRAPAPLGEWVALLAMKYRRAPLPVSRSLEKALMCQDLAVDPPEIGDLARRYLFLGDERMLLAESRERLAPLESSLQFVTQVSTEGQTQTETGVPYQCL